MKRLFNYNRKKKNEEQLFFKALQGCCAKKGISQMRL